jgi:hypothetical protein
MTASGSAAEIIAQESPAAASERLAVVNREIVSETWNESQPRSAERLLLPGAASQIELEAQILIAACGQQRSSILK